MKLFNLLKIEVMRAPEHDAIICWKTSLMMVGGKE